MNNTSKTILNIELTNNLSINSAIIPSTINKKIKHSSSLDWLKESCTARGETALWVAVITQAMQDAISKCKKSESRYQKNEAIIWLTEGGKDFIDVCLCAGFNPDHIRRKAKQTIANPTNWRAEAGTGKRYEERKEYRAKKRAETKKLKQEQLKKQEKKSAQIFNF